MHSYFPAKIRQNRRPPVLPLSDASGRALWSTSGHSAKNAVWSDAVQAPAGLPGASAQSSPPPVPSAEFYSYASGQWHWHSDQKRSLRQAWKSLHYKEACRYVQNLTIRSQYTKAICLFPRSYLLRIFLLFCDTLQSGSAVPARHPRPWSVSMIKSLQKLQGSSQWHRWSESLPEFRNLFSAGLFYNRFSEEIPRPDFPSRIQKTESDHNISKSRLWLPKTLHRNRSYGWPIRTAPEKHFCCNRCPAWSSAAINKNIKTTYACQATGSSRYDNGHTVHSTRFPPGSAV